MATSARERLLAEVATMTEEQIEKLLEYVPVVEEAFPSENAVEADPIVGFISGPTDFGEHAEEILDTEFYEHDTDA